MTRTEQTGTIMIADYDFGDVDIERGIIEGAGFRLRAEQCKSEDEVIEAGRDADGVLTQYARTGSRAIGAFSRCRVIARYGTGVDIVDVDAATRRGIQVTNAPNDWCAEEVADHAIALWLAAARKVCQYDRAVRHGEWRWQTGQPIQRLRGQVFGLLSFGFIARLIAERAQAFGVDVWVHDPFIDEAEMRSRGVRPVSFDEVAPGQPAPNTARLLFRGGHRLRAAHRRRGSRTGPDRAGGPLSGERRDGHRTPVMSPVRRLWRRQPS